jgi:hypothetical protein
MTGSGDSRRTNREADAILLVSYCYAPWSQVAQ